MKTDALIEHLSQFHPKGYDLSLGRIRDLLAKLGHPEHKMPPVFHVAGTNGKGSVIANLTAILQAGGKRVHAHTSPHLVNFHERYRIAAPSGQVDNACKIVSDDMLADVLSRVADANDGAKITVFELLAASMFMLFSEQPADYAIVEVGLGGRFDATNVIDAPLVAVINTISIDHQSYLGDTISKIAFEKAGIIKEGCSVVIGPQVDAAREVLEEIAQKHNCPTMICDQDFDLYEERGRFIYQDGDGLLDLPLPALLGKHQLANSATAIAATRMAKCGLDELAYEKAMGNLSWPGRFEPLAKGKLTAEFQNIDEIWIDGGHNADAGAVIAAELERLNKREPKGLVMICAMLNSKDPETFFAHFSGLAPKMYCIPVAGADHGIPASDLAASAQKARIDAITCDNLEAAISQADHIGQSKRLLICGSLYLVGEVLKKNGTPPSR